MDLVQIRYFLALSRTLNFTRAAEACNVSQPGLTKGIQRLEDELGGPLLLRERSLTQLTELGRTVLPLLQQTFDAAQSAKEHAAGLKRAIAAPLRLGFAPHAPTRPFVPVFAELASKLPGFELILEDADEAGLCDGLLHGTLDAAVVTSGPDLRERLNAWPLFNDELVLVLPPGHKLRNEPGGDKIDVVALEGMHVLTLKSGGTFAAALETGAGKGAGRPAGRHSIQSAGRLAELVRAGFGLAEATTRSAAADLDHRGITGLAPHEVCLVAVAGRPFSRATDAFVKLVRARGWE